MVDETEKVRDNITTPVGNQEVWFLTEDGLYEVFMQSRKPIEKLKGAADLREGTSNLTQGFYFT